MRLSGIYGSPEKKLKQDLFKHGKPVLDSITANEGNTRFT